MDAVTHADQISGEEEIIYLTLEEAAKGEILNKIEKECEYVLEF